MAVKVTHTDVVRVTPGLAETWLNDYPYTGQRKVRQRLVNHYAQEIKDGKFRISEVKFIALNHPVTGEYRKTFLVNGQHRLLAIKQAGVPMDVIKIVLETDNPDDVDHEYVHTDINAVRTAQDMFRPYHVAELCGLPNSREVASHQATVRTIASGFPITSNYQVMLPQLQSRQFLFDLMIEWADEAKEFYGWLHKKDAEVRIAFLRRTVASVVYVTMREQPEKAKAFWLRVIENSGLVRATPEHTLMRFLLTHPAGSLPDHEYSKSVAACWNAHYHGRETFNRVVMTDAMRRRPIEIAGTPYRGQEHLFWLPGQRPAPKEG